MDRYARRQRGDTASSATLIDLEKGWSLISFRTKVILSWYVKRGWAPPAIDVEMAQAEVQRKVHLGQPHFAESREIRETLALRSLAGNMSNRRTRSPRPYLTGVGAAHKGWCSLCGGRIEAGKLWLIPGMKDRWHEECGLFDSKGA